MISGFYFPSVHQLLLTRAIYINVFTYAHAFRCPNIRFFFPLYRLRDAENQLKDIEFPFTKGQDTSELIANELVDAQLVSAADAKSVANAIDHLLGGKGIEIRFAIQLNDPNALADAEALVGFALLVNCS